MNLDLYKAIVPDTPPELLSWRIATGKDFLDEVWEGVYHVIEDKTPLQMDLENEIETWLNTKWVCLSGGRVFRETRLARNDLREFDFRVPSICIYNELLPNVYSDQVLVEPPDVVIEVFSKSGYCTDKSDFYRDLGVGEIWNLDAQTRVCEISVCEDGIVTSRKTNRKQPLVSPTTGIQISPADYSSDCEWLSLIPHPSSNSQSFETDDSLENRDLRKPK